MRKLTLFLALMCLLGLQAAFAQRTITGKITSSEDKLGIPGATVLVKGTTVGVISDANGNFTLQVPKDKNILLISFVGMKTVQLTLGESNVVNVELSPEAQALEGVVITALGISREKKSLGYSVQNVSGEDLIKTRGEANFINTLSGRIAGVQVTGASGTMGGSSRILIRGVNSVSGNNQPLFVIDGIPIDNSDFNAYNTARGGGGFDYGNMAQDVNADDIESVSVLKGPNAAALYGSRAANGVILITTKKGKQAKGGGIGVTWNSSITFDRVAMLPKYQNKYGGGTIYTGEDGKDGFAPGPIVDGVQMYVPDFYTDESWGPKYDENIKVLAWNSFDEWDTENYLKPKPWVAPDHDVIDFFKTGVGFNNTVSFTGATAVSNFRLSYSNLDADGYMPNSKQNKNTIAFNGSTDLSDKLKAFTTFNYVKTVYVGRPETGYGDNNPMVRFNQWGQRQLDMEEMKAYLNPDGSQRTWNRTAWDDPTPVYSNNPYWSRYKDYQDDQRNRYFGNVGLSYQLCPSLRLQGKVNADYYNFRVRERIAIGSAFLSSYIETLRENTEINSELMAFFNKNLTEKISLNATAGLNQMTRKYFRNGGATQGGLVLAGLYTLANSAVPASVDDYSNQKRINSVLGSASFGYNNRLYLDLTGRNDWASTLPEDKNSYFYPSATVSFLLSELNYLKNFKPLSFAKVRVGWAQVGNDTDPYRLLNYYLANDNFGEYSSYRLPTTLNNNKLKPEITTSIEFGAELIFLNNRLGLDITYYDKSSKNQIIPVPTSSATGYRYQIVNAGEITNKGIEIALNTTPVKLNNGFQWNLNFNWAKNENMVVKLAEGVKTYLLGSLFGIEVHAEEGLPYGSIRGYTYVTDDKGNKIVGTNGRYIQSTTIKSVGSVLPDWNMGISNTLQYKDWDFGFFFDIQKGGSLFSLTHMWGMYSGILEESAAVNDKGNEMRDAVADGGGVLNQGVYGKLDANGNVVYLNPDGTTSEVPVANSTYVSALTWAADHYSRARASKNTFGADYIKLREIRLGYNLPSRYLGPIQKANIGVYARNLATWGLKNQHVDPESVTSAGNIQGIEGGQLPPLRSFGINLVLSF